VKYIYFASFVIERLGTTQSFYEDQQYPIPRFYYCMFSFLSE